MKTHDVRSKPNGSVRMSHNPANTPNINDAPPGFSRRTSKNSTDDVNDNDREKNTPDTPLNGQRAKKFLSKNREDDLKFIDTSVESDLPPTLSQLSRKTVQISFERPTFASASTTFTSLDEVASANDFDHEGFNTDKATSPPCKDFLIDSAVDSLNSLEQVIQNFFYG